MRIIFIGASGHGKVCAEIAEMNGYNEILFLDGNKELRECAAYSVVGIENDFNKFIDDDADFFVSIGNTQARQHIQEKIKETGGSIATLIHPASVIGKDVKIGIGSVVMAGAVINPGTTIGEGCIVNTSSSIDHDCIIEAYSHIAVGSHICGSVHVGSNTWVGAGATVSNNVSICSDCIIGAGALVLYDIAATGTYIGVPAKKHVDPREIKENESINSVQ